MGTIHTAMCSNNNYGHIVRAKLWVMRVIYFLGARLQWTASAHAPKVNQQLTPSFITKLPDHQCWSDFRVFCTRKYSSQTRSSTFFKPWVLLAPVCCNQLYTKVISPGVTAQYVPKVYWPNLYKNQNQNQNHLWQSRVWLGEGSNKQKQAGGGDPISHTQAFHT